MADAPSTCPTCGAPVERGQLVCLACGGRVGLRYTRPRRWQVPVLLALIVVALAVAGVVFGLKAASGDAKSEVARTPASRPQASRPDTRPETRTTTQRQTQPGKPAANAALAEAKRGPVAVLSGVPQGGAAKKYARGLEQDGFTLGDVTNAPGGAGAYSVQYVEGSDDAAKALAENQGIQEVKPIEGAVKDRAGDAKLVVIVGAQK